MILPPYKTKLWLEQLPLYEGQHPERGAPVFGAVLRIIHESMSIWVGKTPGIYAVSSTIVVGERFHFCTMQVPGDHALSGPERIVARRVLAAQIPVFDHDIVVDPCVSAWLPAREVVFQMEALDAGELRGDLRQPRLESAVMVSKGVYLASAAR